MLKSYICVRQNDSGECGAACLATVAHTYRLKIPVALIRHRAGTDSRGTTVLGMVEAARHLGFEAKGVRGSKEALGRVPLPGIAHVVKGSFPHYVVIHAVTGRHVTVADPACGIIRYTLEEFIAIWSGILILLVPGATFRAGDRTMSTWRRFARLFAPHGFLMAETILATLFLMLLGLGTSLYVQLLVDKVLPDRNWAMLQWFSLGLIAIVVCRAGFASVRGALVAYIGQKVDLSLTLEYYRHLLSLPMQFFETRRVGEIISRLNDAFRIRDVIGGTTLTLLVDAATMIAGFAILSFYSCELALSGLMLLPLLSLMVWGMNRPLKKAQRATMEEAANLQSHLVESLTGVAAIKAFGAEEAAEYKTETKAVRLLRNLFRASYLSVFSSIGGELVAAIGTAALLWRAGSMVIEGDLTTGQMVAFYSILLYLLQPMLRLAGANQKIQEAVVAADRLGEILDLCSELSDEPNKIALPPDTAGKIDFKHVQFRYGMREHILHDVTFCIPARSIAALIGESGSGKTTLARLLLRFHEPTGGQIEIDGCDLRDLRLDALRARIGYVEQDVSLFSGTIADNLALGNSNASLEAMIAAVRAAGLESFIAGLPHRLQTHIGDQGLALSGGERQRLAIARALVRNPRILILDEATSNIDPTAEQAIMETIRRLKEHMTIVVIAHRLSTALHAESILVLDKGRIVEKGTHRELLEAKGAYCRLWQIQSRGLHCNEQAEFIFSAAEA